jgi:hypothetical protein
MEKGHKALIILLFILLVPLAFAYSEPFYINYTKPFFAVGASWYSTFSDYVIQEDCFLVDAVALKILGASYREEIRPSVMVYHIGYVGCKSSIGWEKVYGIHEIGFGCVLIEEEAASWLDVNIIRCGI